MDQGNSGELFHSNLSDSQFDLNAGATGAAIVTIVSHAGGAFQIKLAGISENWYDIPVSDVWLDRGGTGQLEVIFKPPLDVPPGDNVYNCQIIVTPLDGGAPAKHPVQLTVRGAPGPSCNVVPIRRSGKECIYKVTVMNTLPYDLTINMKAKDKYSDNPKAGFKYSYDRQTFRLIKGSTEEVELGARPKKRPWFGWVSNIDFMVSAIPESSIYKPAEAEAKAYIYPGPPWWLVLLMILMLSAGLWLLWPKPKEVVDQRVEPPLGDPAGRIVVLITNEKVKVDEWRKLYDEKGKPFQDILGTPVQDNGKINIGQCALGSRIEKRIIVKNDWPKEGDPSFLRVKPPVLLPDSDQFSLMNVETDPLYGPLEGTFKGGDGKDLKMQLFNLLRNDKVVLNPQQATFFVIRFMPTKQGKFETTIYVPNSSAMPDDKGAVVDRRKLKFTIIGEGI